MGNAEPIRLTRAQVREVDRRATDQFHIPGIVLMENAARGVVDVAMSYIRQAQMPKTLVICGGGNNGGDGLAVARHLHNRRVDVHLTFPAFSHPVAGGAGEGVNLEPKYSGDALTNFRICQAMKIPVIAANLDAISSSGFLVMIDAIFGTGLTRPPSPQYEDIFSAAMLSGAQIIAVDLPSGLDCDTGEPLGETCIAATHTVTFVAEKAGFANPKSKQFTGEITVADIGCPVELSKLFRSH